MITAKGKLYKPPSDYGDLPYPAEVRVLRVTLPDEATIKDIDTICWETCWRSLAECELLNDAAGFLLRLRFQDLHRSVSALEADAATVKLVQALRGKGVVCSR